jgi:thiol-disulfide isomerase/thioredoxin/uncharacterized membrane protein YphA (DoxX/SURF4 family)
MHSVLLAARILLAAVFALAALTKLADLRGSRDAVAGFGVPAPLAGPLGLLLPIAELAVAVLLLPAATARIGALGATLLLAVFVIAIGRSLARGAATDCHCFGQLHSEPVGWRTLARNGVLAGIAVFVVVAGRSHVGPSATAWIGGLSDAGVVAVGGGLALALLAGAASAAWLALLRQNGRLLLRIDELEARLDAAGVRAPAPAHAHVGLPLGEQAPAFTLSGLYGETVTLASLTAAERPVMLLFTDPTCAPCNALMPQLAAWQREHAEDLTLAVLTRGSAEDNRAKMREHGIANVWVDDQLTVYEAYEANGTPGAVLIDVQGRIASAVVAGTGPIGELVGAALDPHLDRVVPVAEHPAQGPNPHVPPAPRPPMLPLGADAPQLELHGLAGEPLELTDADADTLILFWNPSCGFCQRMLADIRVFERERPAGAPRLLLISTGSVADNEAMGLECPIALDQAFAAGRAFGTTGTPSGVLVDSNGRVASPLAVGAPGVLALARREGRDQTGRLQHR